MSARITILRVLTSFVPPVHIQSVSSAPLQNPVLWKIFLLNANYSCKYNYTSFKCTITYKELSASYQMPIITLQNYWEKRNGEKSALLLPFIPLHNKLNNFYTKKMD